MGWLPSAVYIILITPNSVRVSALKSKMSPGALTEGGVGIRRMKGDASACLQGCSAALGSAGSTLGKATLLRLPESVNKQTNKQTNVENGPAVVADAH